MTGPGRIVGDGPLHRLTTTTYWFLVIEALLVLTMAPGLVAALFLTREASSLPFYALAAVPIGPAVSAAVFAWRVFLAERDPSPGQQFWRGYKLGAADALRAWVPALVMLTLLGTNVVVGSAMGLSAVPTGLFVGLGFLTLLWAARMLVITSAFTFRWRDAARIVLITFGSRRLASLGLFLLLVFTIGVALVTFEAAVVLLASILTYVLTRNEAPVLVEVQAQFVTPPPDDRSTP